MRSVCVCGHVPLGDWLNPIDPQSYCPYCCYVSQLHRGFYTTQLDYLGVWDEVMKELKDHYPPRDGTIRPGECGQNCQMDSSGSCPCVSEGRMRQNCRCSDQCQCHHMTQGGGSCHRFSESSKQDGPSSSSHCSDGQRPDYSDQDSEPHYRIS